MASSSVKRKPKNIVELFTYDITTFFMEEDYEEVSSEEDGSSIVVEFEKNLPWIEHGLFEKIVFRMFNAKNNIEGSSHINVRFPCSQFQTKKDKVVELTNVLADMFGDDDEKRSKWTPNEDVSFGKKNINRFWTMGDDDNIYSVELRVDESKELLLRVLFFNHLMNTLN